MQKLSAKVIRWGVRDLAAAEEIAESLRRWAARSRVFDKGFAQALCYRARFQIDEGLYPEALAGLDQVVALHGRPHRAARRGWAWLNARAGWLRAVVLFRRDEFEAAVRTAEVAVDQYRVLATAAGKRFEPSYALVLGFLANCYYGNDRLDDAVRTGERAAEIARRVHARGGECDIASTLVNLCGRLHDHGRIEDATRYAQVAVNILRRHPNPPLLALALINLGASLSETRPREALSATDEALAILDELLADDPAEYEPHLDLARRNRAIALDRLHEN